MQQVSLPRTSQVLVVGGGPAGSSAAWHLAERGLDVVLVDRARFPRDKTCAEYVSPEGSRILAAMGALSLIEQAGAAQLAGMMVRAPSGATIRGEFAATHGFRGFRDSGLALRRIILDEILLNRARAAGVTVIEGAKVEALTFDAHGRCCGAELRHDSAMRTQLASVVVGADGLRSIVARRLGLARTSRWPRRLAFVAHYQGVNDMGPLGEMHVERDGYIGLASVGSGITNVALVMPQKRTQPLSSPPDVLLTNWIRTHRDLAPRFVHAERIDAVRTTGPFASHAARAWAAGAVLVGDAADFFDPFTGEGIYAALRGGELLAPFVEEAVRATTAKSASRALKDYDVARRKTFAGKWRVERAIGLGVAFPILMERAARVLERDSELADLLVGVAGDFVPPRALLSANILRRMLFPGFGPRISPTVPMHGHRS